jgi:hypothetical protein
LPNDDISSDQVLAQHSRYKPTITAGLYASLNVPYALNGDPVLIVSINELVLKFTNFKDEHSKLVCNVGHVFVAFLTPNRELTGNLTTFTTDQLH